MKKLRIFLLAIAAVLGLSVQFLLIAMLTIVSAIMMVF